MSDTLTDFERALAETGSGDVVLKLYISGMTPRSRQAIADIKALCEEHFPGRYSIDIIDIYQQPRLATEAQIVAAPTLVKLLPLPVRKLFGSLPRGSDIVRKLLS